MTVVGVDGWKDGWVAAVATGRHLEWSPYPQPGGDRPRDAFAAILADFASSVVAVDIPIGSVEGIRPSDSEAATWLHDNGAQRSSIFMTPSTDLIDAYRLDPSHRAAMAQARARGAAGTSIQAWNLIPKIVETELAVRERATTSPPVVEAHPECSFRQLELTLREKGYDEPRLGTHSKKTAVGVGLRIRLLQAVFDLPELTDAPAGVPVDDLLDACAVAWTAQRVASGAPDLRTFPARPREGDPRIVV